MFCWGIVLVAEESMHYFVLNEGMGEVAGAIADDKPDKSGLQKLLLGAQCSKHLIQEDMLENYTSTSTGLPRRGLQTREPASGLRAFLHQVEEMYNRGGGGH